MRKGTEDTDVHLSLWSTPRGALRLRVLLPCWMGVLVVWTLFRAGCPSWVAVAIAAILGLLTVTWVAAFAARDLCGPANLTLGHHARLVLRGLPCILQALGGLAAMVGLCLALACAGSLLRELPWAGPVLASIWLWTAGVLLCLLAAVCVLVGVPALLLTVPFAVAEVPDSMVAVSATQSYVRARPLRLAGSLLAVVAASLLALIPLGMVLLTTGLLVGSVDGLVAPKQVFLAFVEAVQRGDAASWPAGLLASAVALAGFLWASWAVGLTRVYLRLRREVDGTPVTRVESLK